MLCWQSALNLAPPEEAQFGLQNFSKFSRFSSWGLCMAVKRSRPEGSGFRSHLCGSEVYRIWEREMVGCAGVVCVGESGPVVHGGGPWPVAGS